MQPKITSKSNYFHRIYVSELIFEGPSCIVCKFQRPIFRYEFFSFVWGLGGVGEILGPFQDNKDEGRFAMTILLNPFHSFLFPLLLWCQYISHDHFLMQEEFADWYASGELLNRQVLILARILKHQRRLISS